MEGRREAAAASCDLPLGTEDEVAVVRGAGEVVDAQSVQEGLWSLSVPWGSSSWRILVVVVGTRLLSPTRRVALHPTTNELTDSISDRVWHKSLGTAFIN